MKEQDDLVIGLMRKAASDMRAAHVTLEAGAFDAAAFHAQQAVERFLKAFLASRNVEFAYTHNLTKLVEQCAELDEQFLALSTRVEPLTPYAVELRYDSDFWPTEEAATQANRVAEYVYVFLMQRMPAHLIPRDGNSP
jgi:HEPN domain-containing protein